MKKVIAPFVIGIILTVALASCGSAQHGNCEAYGGDAVSSTPSELPDITR
jgi:hypothetical protein